jgi:hypothetical protein
VSFVININRPSPLGPNAPELRWNSSGITLVESKAGVAGNKSNDLQYPFGIVLDWNNTLFISDTHNHRIQKYSLETSSVVTVAGNANGTSCYLLTCLHFPSCIDLDQSGHLFIADTGSHRVMFWEPGALSGRLAAGVTSKTVFPLVERGVAIAIRVCTLLLEDDQVMTNIYL